MANNFDFEKLKNNPYAQVLISGSGVLVKGVYTNDLVIRAGNSFDSPLEAGGEKVSSGANSLIASANILGADIDAVKLGSLKQSVKNWTGSEIPVFTLDMVFIAIRPGDDVVNMVHQLYATVFPAAQSSAVSITPPLGYTAGGSGGIQKGGFFVSVGTWFRANNQVMKNVNFTFSKEVTPDGKPLYARGSIEFEHYRQMTYKDFRDFFVKLPSRTSQGNNAAAKDETRISPNQGSGTIVGNN